MKKIFVVIIATCLLGTSLQAQQSIDIEAHQGGSALLPGNTIPAMLNAVKLGARTLELDCIISADKKVVVSHDPFMSSMLMLKPNGDTITKAEERSLALYTMTYDSIKKYDAGMKFRDEFPDQIKMKAHKPLLSALIDSVELYVKQHHLKPVYYNVETKSSPAGDDIYHPKPVAFVDLIMNVIKEKGIEDRVIIQSFDVRTLQALHTKYPGQKTALLVGNPAGFKKNIEMLGFTPTYYSPNYLLVTEELVKDAHAAKIAVLPWTVNKEEDIKRMIDLQVDGIISDHPEILIRLLGSWQR
ncbi:glycerophosphodiester phosphodiesterase family protein [Chitinophagaceae bacterium LWZ2-11]